MRYSKKGGLCLSARRKKNRGQNLPSGKKPHLRLADAKNMPVLNSTESEDKMKTDTSSLVHCDDKVENGFEDSTVWKTVSWNISTLEPVKCVGLIPDCRSLARFNIKEEDGNKFKDFSDVTTQIKSLVNQTEEYSKKIRSFIDEKSFLFMTPLESLKIHPQILKSENAINGSPNALSQPTGDGLEVVTVVPNTKVDLPPAGELKRKEIKIGTEVWVMKTNTVDVFVEGAVLSVRDTEKEKLYKVRFEETKGIAPKLYTSKQLAYRTTSEVIVPVGTRIVARYADGYLPKLYAGIVAEPPKITNQSRYLIFFDDGYAQYMNHEDIYVMCAQSIDVANDVHPNIGDFIKAYLQKYPERPMVKLQKNQITKTEFDRKWWDTKVMQVDASMVKMYFLASGRTEWIYRGSTRLKLLYSELANAEAHRVDGKHRRHNIVPRKPHQPYVEYTREPGDIVTIDSGSEDESTEVGQHQHPRRKTGGSQYLNGEKPKNTARKRTAQQNHFSENEGHAMYHPPDIRSHSGYKDLHNLVSFDRNKYKPHNSCTALCREKEDPHKFKGKNPFLIPIYLGWERQLRKYQRSGTKNLIIYRAPCGRHLRNLQEIEDYLTIISSRLSINLFSVDQHLIVFRTFRPKEAFFESKDVTQGNENVPVCAVNSWTKDPPPFVEYASKRFPGQGVYLNEDKDFLCGCSCTDNCAQPALCECQQITNYAYSGQISGNVGYKHQRLRDPVITGIYECNAKCKCGPRCGNRVVQKGLQVRLQMFKTENKGWGIRCLDDLDAGMFICIYAGQLLTEQGADEDGNQFGDEYLAELDHIEVVEKTKEGYESDVTDFENMDLGESEHTKENDDDSKSEEPSPNSSDSEVNVCDTDSDFESSIRNTASTTYTTRSRKKTKRSDSSSNVSASSSNDFQDESSNQDDKKTISKELPDVTTGLDSFTIIPRPLSPTSAELVEKMELKRTPQISENETDTKSVAKKSLSMKHPVAAPLIPAGKQSRYKSIRAYYGENSLYIMDAKSKGNIGRYLNHSCSPNVFVQNVFVETHDLRFPEVAFFAQNFIQAGAELTWDYNYEVGSVTDKVMYCYCDARNCRGRLL